MMILKSRVTNYIKLTTATMSKESVYVRILGNHYLLDAFVVHIYKNVLYWKFLLITKKGYVVSPYRSPSKTPDKFDSSNNNLEKPVINIYSRKADFVLMIGDFNVKSCHW